LVALRSNGDAGSVECAFQVGTQQVFHPFVRNQRVLVGQFRHVVVGLTVD
jgi:hypothetical protein